MRDVLLGIAKKLGIWGGVSAAFAYVHSLIYGGSFQALFFSENWLMYTVFMPTGIYAGIVLMRYYRQG